MSFFSLLWEGIKATSLVEWLAVVSSIVYVILAAKRIIWCWLFAFIGSLLFVYLCYVGQLYIEASLQLFYVAMAVVGWLSWNHSDQQVAIDKWSSKYHVLNVLICATIAMLIGFLFDQYTQQAYPYVDAFTTVFSLSATYMVARKILGNWVYWIFIDIFLIYLYAQRDYHLTAVQYVIFTVLAVYGYLAWKKEYKRQQLC